MNMWGIGRELFGKYKLCGGNWMCCVENFRYFIGVVGNVNEILVRV